MPPTGSTTAAQRSFSIGRLDSSEVSSRERISLAPSSRSQSASSGLPVAAATSNPRAARMPTAVEPTPPEAPSTRTGPSSGVTPWSSSRCTDSPAVKPAVPSAIAWRALSPSGSGMTQSPGTRAYSAKPPWWATPRSWPWTMTASPSPSPETTVPARSTPGTSGEICATLPFGETASASL